MATGDEVLAKSLAGAICPCALERGRVLHRGDCPLYPGEVLRPFSDTATREKTCQYVDISQPHLVS